MNLVSKIDALFVSGNSVPVERASIKLEDWAVIRDQLLAIDVSAIHLANVEHMMEDMLEYLQRPAEGHDDGTHRAQACKG